MAGRPKKVTIEVEPVYSVDLHLNNQEYLAEHADLSQALNSIKPTFFKTKGSLTVSKNGMKVIKPLNIPIMKRLFGVGGTNTQKMTTAFVASNLKFLLGEK